MRSTSGLPKIPQISWTVCGWSVHSSEGTLLRDSMSAPRFSLPGTSVALSERKLSWAQLKRHSARIKRSFEERPLWGKTDCSWVEEGWLPSERKRRSQRRSPEAGACCHPPCLGRSRERGTRCRLPSLQSARRRRSIEPSSKDVQYHRMAPRVRAS